MTENEPEGLPPFADLSEALARGREPRKLWPVLHSVDDTTKSNLRPAILCTLRQDGWMHTGHPTYAPWITKDDLSNAKEE